MRKFLKKFEVTDIKKLTNYQINKLEVGDVVAKNTNGQYHNYIVSYKQNGVGMCLTYSDATYLETISYDYVDGNWVYNSQDSTVVASKSYVDSLMSGALKRTIVEALPETNIDTNTIYMVLDQSASQQGNVYNEYMYINNAWELIGTTATSGDDHITLANGTTELTMEQIEFLENTPYAYIVYGGTPYYPNSFNGASLGYVTQVDSHNNGESLYIKSMVISPRDGSISIQEWTLATSGGSDNTFVVTFDQNGDQEQTNQEILEAFQSGKLVYFLSLPYSDILKMGYGSNDYYSFDLMYNAGGGSGYGIHWNASTRKFERIDGE